MTELYEAEASTSGHRGRSVLADRRSVIASFRAKGSRLAVPAILVLLIVVFSVLRPSTFATGSNAATVTQNQVVLLIIALGSLLPLIVGEFDLSVGYVASTMAVLEVQLVGNDQWNPIVATILVLLFGIAIGMVNALLVVVVGVNSFIATLGVGSVLTGLGSYVSNDQTLFQGVPGALITLGAGHWGSIPINLFAALGFVVAISYLLRWTALGRYMYAVGASREAARLSGVATETIRAGALVASALLATCAGLLELGLIGSASTSIGPEFLLPALAACFLGTTMGENGRFNVFGTIVAIFLIAVGVTGLEQLGVPNWVEPVFDGGALVVAVSLTLVGQRMRGARRRASRMDARSSTSAKERKT